MRCKAEEVGRPKPLPPAPVRLPVLITLLAPWVPHRAFNRTLWGDANLRSRIRRRFWEGENGDRFEGSVFGLTARGLCGGRRAELR